MHAVAYRGTTEFRTYAGPWPGEFEANYPGPIEPRKTSKFPITVEDFDFGEFCRGKISKRIMEGAARAEPGFTSIFSGKRVDCRAWSER